LIYQTLEEAIIAAECMIESFDDDYYDLIKNPTRDWIKITAVEGGGFELFGHGDVVKII